jgi:hypothetical protein
MEKDLERKNISALSFLQALGAQVKLQLLSRRLQLALELPHQLRRWHPNKAHPCHILALLEQPSKMMLPARRPPINTLKGQVIKLERKNLGKKSKLAIRMKRNNKLNRLEKRLDPL